MKRKIYMMISNDEYELPLAIADTARELAEMVGTTTNCIHSTISHCKHGSWKRAKYICVEVEDDETE